MAPRSAPNSWLKLAMCAVFIPRKRWWPLQAVDAPPYHPAKWMFVAAVFPSGDLLAAQNAFSGDGVLLQCAPMDEPVYQFMNKKRSEGKPYRVYMMASANKFLRIYYASVKAYLDSLEHD